MVTEDVNRYKFKVCLSLCEARTNYSRKWIQAVLKMVENYDKVRDAQHRPRVSSKTHHRFEKGTRVIS